MPRAKMIPCPDCGGTPAMVPLDDGDHWIGACECGRETAKHWNRRLAREIWNAATKPSRAVARSSAPTPQEGTPHG